MVVALKGMAVDAAVVVAVVFKHLSQVDSGLWQILDVERHVLDEHCGAQGARATHAGEDARANGPVLAIDLGVAGEDGRDKEVERLENRHYLVDVALQLVVAVGKGLDEYCGEALAGGVVDAGERFLVENLGTVHGTFLHRHHCLAALAHVLEIEHSAGAAGVEVTSLHCELAGKGECALTTHDEVGDDVEGVAVEHKWRDVQSSHVLDGILVTDAVDELLVGIYPVANLLDAVNELGVRLLEGVAACLVASVEHCAIGQDDAH